MVTVLGSRLRRLVPVNRALRPRRLASTRASASTLRFGAPEPSFAPTHHVFVGDKSRLARADTQSLGIPATAAAAVAHVVEGREKVVKIWVGENSYTFAELETKTSRNLGVIRSDTFFQSS